MSGAGAAPSTGGRVREGLKRLTAESMVYGLGQVGGRAVQLLLVPILTRALSAGAFGVTELVIAYSQTVMLVLVMGMDGALGRFFYGEPDREARIRMASTALIFRLVTGGIAALLLIAFAAPLAARLIGGPGYAKYLAIGATTLPFTLIVLFCNDLLRITFQPWKFIVLNLVQTSVVLGLSLYLVVVLKVGVVGVLYGRLAGDALAAAAGLVLSRHTLRPRFDAGTLRRMLVYGVPMVPALFAFGAIASFDRYVLQRTRTLEELAVYAVAAKFFTVVTVAASAFQLAYGPFAYARAGTPEAPRLFARVLAGYVALGSLGALAVAAFAPEILSLLVPPAYAGAAAPALWLAFAAVAFGVYTVAAIGITLALRTPLLGLCAAAAALVAAAAQWILTPRLGATGAAIGTFVGYAASAVLTYVTAQRVHPLPYRGMRLAALFVIAFVAALAAQRSAPPGVLGVAIKLATVAGYAALVLGMGIHRERGAVAAHAREGS